MTSDVENATKALIAECCERHNRSLLALETDQDHVYVLVFVPPRFSSAEQDHVYVLVFVPPRFSSAEIANLLKGYSSRYLRERFPHLERACGKDHLWTQSYYVGTAGAVSAETIRRYIMECQGK